MFIEPLNQDIMIVSHEEALFLHNARETYWNVLSITDRIVVERPVFPNVRRIGHFLFDDVERDYPGQGIFAATLEDVQATLDFARDVGDGPLLIHCHAGVSRSTAIAWLIILDKLVPQPETVHPAFELVRELRPNLQPNRRVLKLGIEALVAPPDRDRVQEEFQSCLAELGFFEPL